MACSIHTNVDNSVYEDFYTRYFKNSATPNTAGKLQYFLLNRHNDNIWYNRKGKKGFVNNIIDYLNKNDTTYSFAQKKANINELQCWGQCKYCKGLFTRICKVVDKKNDYVIFKNQDYPEEIKYAISCLKREMYAVSWEVCFNLFSKGYNEQLFSVYYEDPFSEDVTGGFDHLYLDVKPMNSESIDEAKFIAMNNVIKEYGCQFIKNLETWNHHLNALECIDNAFKERGTSSPGYKQYGKSVPWFIRQIKNTYSMNYINKQIYIIDELVRLMSSMDVVENVIGMIATFSPKGNIIACMNVRTPQQFWKIIEKRTEPTKYQVTTAAPKKGAIDNFIKEFGVEKINEMFSRRTIDIYEDKFLEKWLFWRKEINNPFNPINSRENFSISDLYNGAKKKAPKTTNCFSSMSNEKTYYSYSEFIDYLKTLKGDEDIKWKPSSFYSTTYAVPIYDSAREFLMREGSWILNTNLINIPSYKQNCYIDVNVIGSHASTWESNFPNKYINSEIGSGNHIEQLCGLDKGMIIVLKDKTAIPGYTHEFKTNCLFAEFFNGKFHKYKHIRGKYQTETRITYSAKNPYAGALIVRGTDITGEHFTQGHTKYMSGNYKTIQIFKINNREIYVY